MKLAGYLRVSTTAQVNEGLGLEVQRGRIEAWAEAEGHQIVRWFADEGISGRTLDRDGLQDAVNAMSEGSVEGIAAADLDRFSRKLQLQEAILGSVWMYGGRVFTCRGEILQDDPEDPTRTLIRQIMGAIAEWEAVNIKNRMVRGRRKKMEQGGYGGGYIPFGLRLSGDRLVEDPFEMPRVTRIMELKASMSYEHLAEQLNEERLFNRAGSEWNVWSVRRVVRHWQKRGAA